MSRKIMDSLGNVAEKVGNAFDKNFTSKHEKLQEKNRSIEMNTQDRASARIMYQADASLQKWFAIVFLVGYMLLVIGMIYFIFTLAGGADEPKLPDWAIAFLSTIFGAISMKVSTITDFLFGGSKTAEIEGRRRR